MNNEQIWNRKEYNGGMALDRFGDFSLDDTIITDASNDSSKNSPTSKNKKSLDWRKTAFGTAIVWILSAWWVVWSFANQDWVKDREPVVKKDPETTQLLAWAGN